MPRDRPGSCHLIALAVMALLFVSGRHLQQYAGTDVYTQKGHTPLGLCLKRPPNVETRFYRPHAFLSLDVLGLKRAEGEPYLWLESHLRLQAKSGCTMGCAADTQGCCVWLCRARPICRL